MNYEDEVPVETVDSPQYGHVCRYSSLHWANMNALITQGPTNGEEWLEQPYKSYAKEKTIL
jgi:hypothetical protein